MRLLRRIFKRKIGGLSEERKSLWRGHLGAQDGVVPTRDLFLLFDYNWMGWRRLEILNDFYGLRSAQRLFGPV